MAFLRKRQQLTGTERTRSREQNKIISRNDISRRLEYNWPIYTETLPGVVLGGLEQSPGLMVPNRVWIPFALECLSFYLSRQMLKFDSLFFMLYSPPTAIERINTKRLAGDRHLYCR